MAKHTVTQITDDLDGSKDAQEIAFSFQGVDYNVDLGKKNLAALEKALKPYLDAATKVAKRSSVSRRSSSRSTKATAGNGDLRDVRTWAKTNGIKVSERGRVSRSVLEQYDAATR